MLFDQNDWKLKVTDIDLYANTCKLDGQSYPLSLAIKTLIPGYLSGLPSTSRESMELLEALAEAGVAIGNFFSNDLMTAYQRRQMNKRVEAERIAKEQRIQADRMREENMTDEEWQKELQRREQVKAERRTYGENLRSATHSAGRSRASIMADLDSGANWMDSI
ncbi:hypothetical protein ACT35X_002231 [Enterobacter hormaechei]|uniref:hypothetical protein n=1 Tax=Enterobacteriaceae TaxID=543 RepID=UPI00159AF570|nr:MULTISPECIES: hypothetical protein [Enterobacteriaceae]EHK0832984.1 hypothetical protein [Escherichia coli]EHN8813340.1 hypothetical protein [Enterobacter hormaechei]QLS98538.1 hypothetical protein HV301_04510 [Citrobacter freundii]HCM9369506.1 hypothetical protein [Enterobacter hormaechei subsp. xiangfangensis]EHF3721873.1 hypothetical protein [Shigella flexneri]